MEMAPSEHPVEIKNLTFAYSALEGEPITRDLSLSVPAGTRCLLIGSNGAGKTTLLNVLGGKHMHSNDAVQILGQPAFGNTHPLVTVLSGQWNRHQGSGAAPYQNDVSVEDMLAASKNREDVDPYRLALLLHILDINLKWRMHMVSDGQRRRVQIMMALLKPFEVLLLDEVTVDLDVVARADLLDFLKSETETRGATIIYATHIFDGLDEWATHLAYLSQGVVARYAPVDEYEDLQAIVQAGSISPLLDLVEQWLRAERVVLEAAKAAAAEKKKLAAEKKAAEAASQPKKARTKYGDASDPFAGASRGKSYNYW